MQLTANLFVTLLVAPQWLVVDLSSMLTRFGIHVIHGLVAKFNHHKLMHVVLCFVNLNIQAQEKAEENSIWYTLQRMREHSIQFSFIKICMCSSLKSLLLLVLQSCSFIYYISFKNKNTLQFRFDKDLVCIR